MRATRVRPRQLPVGGKVRLVATPSPPRQVEAAARLSRGAETSPPLRQSDQSVSKWKVSTEILRRSSELKLPEAPS
jgi:hypothetical protein